MKKIYVGVYCTYWLLFICCLVPPKVHVFQNSSSLWCRATGYPAPHIQWYKLPRNQHAEGWVNYVSVCRWWLWRCHWRAHMYRHVKIYHVQECAHAHTCMHIFIWTIILLFIWSGPKSSLYYFLSQNQLMVYTVSQGNNKGRESVNCFLKNIESQSAVKRFICHHLGESMGASRLLFK